MAPFYGWGSTASRLVPLQGGSLLFTTKFPHIPGTHFINLGRMKDWVNLELALDYILSNNPEVNISRKDLKKLFQFATSEIQFYFNKEVYEQVDRVVMGSPLSPVLANLFMGHHE